MENDKDYWEKYKYLNDPAYKVIVDKRRKDEEQDREDLKRAKMKEGQLAAEKERQLKEAQIERERLEYEAVVKLREDKERLVRERETRERADKERKIRAIQQEEERQRLQEEADQENKREIKVLKSWGRRQILKNLSSPATPKVLSIECSCEQEKFTAKSMLNRLRALRELGYVEPHELGEGLWVLTEAGTMLRDKYLK